MTSQALQSASRTWWKRHRTRVILSLALGIGCAWILRHGALPLVPPASAFADVRWWSVLAYGGVWLLVLYIRAARWYWLLAAVHRVPLARVVSVAIIGFAAILLLPLRTGEAVRPVMIRRSGKLTGWEATGTVAAERIIDGLVLSSLLVAALTVAPTLDPLPRRIGDLPIPVAAVPGLTVAALSVFAAAFAVLALFYLFQDRARRLIETVIGKLSPSLGSWFAQRIEQVARGLDFLRHGRLAVPFIIATCAYWALNVAGSWLLAWGVGFDDITAAQACVLTGVLALGILVPNAPGFFGTFQISIYAALAMFYPKELIVGPGAAYIFLLYIIQVGLCLLTAGGALLVSDESLDGAVEAAAKPVGEAVEGDGADRPGPRA